MIVKRLVEAPCSKFGIQTIIVRSKKNVWGTYGYSNFRNYDKEDKFPLISKFFHTFIFVGLVSPFINWDPCLEMLEEKYEKIRDATSSKRESDSEDKPKLKLRERFRINNP